MAITITSNFNGDYAMAIYKDLAEGNEVVNGNKWSNGGIAYLELDVPDKRELRSSKISKNPIGAYVKTPTSGDVTFSFDIDKRELNLVKSMIYERFSPEDYDFEWEDLRSIGSQTEHKISPKLFRELLVNLIPEIGAQISLNFFQGDTAGAAGLDRFDGLVKKAMADANTIKVLPAGVIDALNVVSVLQSTVDAITAKDYNNNDYKLLVSMATWRIIQRLNTDTKKTSDGILNDEMKNLFEEKRIIPFVGMADDYVIATKVGTTTASNLHFGFWFDETREMQDIRVDRVANDSDEWFMRINIKMDMNYKYSENVIIYAA